MINRIAPYSGSTSNSKNKANSTNNTTFKSLVARELPEPLIRAANRVANSVTVTARNIELSGKPCQAKLGRFCGNDNLCFYVIDGNRTIRYRLPLDSSGEVSPLRELYGETLKTVDEYAGEDIPVGDPAIDQAVSTVEAALRELDN